MIGRVVCILMVVGLSQAVGYLGGSSAANPNSLGSRTQDDSGNYAFNYQVVDNYGASNGRREVGDGYGNKMGSYHITDVDGRSRQVDYVADRLGFRATVNTNEPGTMTSVPAGAVFNTPFTGYPAAGYAPASTGGPGKVAAAPFSPPLAPAGIGAGYPANVGPGYPSKVGAAAPSPGVPGYGAAPWAA